MLPLSHSLYPNRVAFCLSLPKGTQHPCANTLAGGDCQMRFMRQGVRGHTRAGVGCMSRNKVNKK